MQPVPLNLPGQATTPAAGHDYVRHAAAVDAATPPPPWAHYAEDVHARLWTRTAGQWRPVHPPGYAVDWSFAWGQAGPLTVLVPATHPGPGWEIVDTHTTWGARDRAGAVEVLGDGDLGALLGARRRALSPGDGLVCRILHVYRNGQRWTGPWQEASQPGSVSRVVNPRRGGAR